MDDEERRKHIHHTTGLYRHSAGGGGAANSSSTHACAVQHHSHHAAEFESTGRGGVRNIVHERSSPHHRTERRSPLLLPLYRLLPIPIFALIPLYTPLLYPSPTSSCPTFPNHMHHSHTLPYASE
ncbi:hypothetical protein BDZ97DRAFT_2081869 [Flammula alnicola]|nr:hypothetical protein BDZ97DRAFT_2081869 [Flammula alnicola]